MHPVCQFASAGQAANERCVGVFDQLIAVLDWCKRYPVGIKFGVKRWRLAFGGVEEGFGNQINRGVANGEEIEPGFIRHPSKQGDVERGNCGFISVFGRAGGGVLRGGNGIGGGQIIDACAIRRVRSACIEVVHHNHGAVGEQGFGFDLNCVGAVIVDNAIDQVNEGAGAVVGGAAIGRVTGVLLHQFIHITRVVWVARAASAA